MPDVSIVDAHVHLWDPSRFRMKWLDGTSLDKPFGLDDYRQATEGLPLAGMVYLQVDVEPAYGLLEAQWAVDRAAEDPRLQGIVAWAPLEDGERARAFVEALTRISPIIKGVRRLVQAEPDPAFCVQPEFVRGVQLLADYGLSFDICTKGEAQLANAIELVRQCPGIKFMLDHFGKPDIAQHVLDPWRQHMSALAELPNVMCKVSGLVTEANHQSWTADDLAPYVLHVLDTFGEDRVAFGGDWPVVTQAAAYRRWVETLDGLTVAVSARAKQKLWGDNARRFYRL